MTECRFWESEGPFAIDKRGEAALRAKVATFRAVTGTRCAVHLTLVTPHGVVPNAHAGIVQSQVTLDDLFAE